MKRLISWTLAVMCLMGCLAAADSVQTFEFRNGVTWNMGSREVLESEEIQEYTEEIETDEIMNGVEVVMLSDVEVSKFNADLSYVFIEDSLQMCLYELTMDEKEAAYLTGALKTKYGQLPVETNEFLYGMMCRLVPDVYGEENPFGNGLCWHLPDGTVIQLVPVKESGDYGLVYMNYDTMNELLDKLEKEGYNLFGL